LLRLGLERKTLGVRLLGVGVRFNEEPAHRPSQLELF
jgi:hypothetical protein